ncbi:CYTH and CHAD domain-containing protein [Paracraurococcus lichenis]|uniref:CHAD domain-containing protein n=1 Tax=Paracraurococcus lichenis TaxID=3064888 RepID=A0ABT9DZY3_9PROT|nr:CHAD domain-containing protein [Paracraurococcus sp. LOR1-02]MDO9709443.1 CHAD domain-containing protein [Paracraurococcus sp. LOR1-02]
MVAGPERPRLALEFEIEPEAAGRVTRQGTVAAARTGRARSAAAELIWLDSAEGRLAAEGLALEQSERGLRRLLRTMPEADRPWLPGTPPETVRLDSPEDGPMVPLSAFSGRQTSLSLATAAGPVQLQLLLGKLRAVADERPAARLQLEGPAEAVLALAGQLAADLPLLPPRAALAEEGRALARGEAPRPRRRGPPDLAGAATVEEALVAAIGHLLEVMLHHAPACRLGAGPEGVHQMRVGLRRLRSVLKVFRPAAGCPEAQEFDVGLKVLADRLGPARDWDVFLAGLGAAVAEALEGDKRIAALMKAAEAKRQAAYAALRAELDGPGFRRLVLAGLGLLLRRPWRAAAGEEDGAERLARLEEALPEFAAALLDKRWHKLCSEGEEIEGHSAEALHEVRLEAKRLRYAAELFAPLWPGKATRRFQKRLSALQEELGFANDTAVARSLVASLGPGVPAWAVGAVEGFATARVGAARKHALAAWEDLMLVGPSWTRL